MSTDKETNTDVQPKKWLMFRRRQKLSNCESRAAPQEAEEHRDSCAASVARAAAAESRAAPHSPRGRGQALLRSLRRGCRAIVSGMAAVIRRRGQQPGTRRPPHQGMEAVTAATAPAAGAESRAAAPHSPCCPPSPEPGQLEALGGQGAGAAMGTVLETAEGEEKVCFSLEQVREVDSSREGEEDQDQSMGSGEEKPPVRPRKAWAEQGNLPACTATGQALPSRAPHSRAEASMSYSNLNDLPPMPSVSQVEARRQWARAAAKKILADLQREEEAFFMDTQDSSSREESIDTSWTFEPRLPEPCYGTGHLGLFPQCKDQSVMKVKVRIVEEAWQESWVVITVRTIWVNPLYLQLLEPLPGEEDPELPSTYHSLAASMDAMPAAAALAGDPEEQEYPVSLTAEEAKIAPSAASVEQAAAAESQAAPHSPRGLLHLLRRSSRAILSGMAAVIQRRSHQPGTQRHLHQGTGTETAVTVPAAGAESRAAAPHSPCCPPRPEPSRLEALGGQGAGTAMGTILPTPEDKGKACFSLEQGREVDSPKELSLGESDRDHHWGTAEERPPVRPHEAWAEHGNFPS